jgi:hypothetical protein
MSLSKTLDTNYVDLLDEDKPISGQKFACISFLSPEKILKKKELFFFEEFVKKWDFLKSMEKFQQFMNFISYKYKLNNQNIANDLENFVKEESSNLQTVNIEDDYKNFIDANEEKLGNSFNNKYQYQTNVRGLKVRGVFPSQEEAEMKSKQLREQDPNHDVYVGQVGMWMPWDPEAYKTGRVEYLEKELNDLMHEKVKNEENAKVEFEKRVRETKEKAMEENRNIAEKSGNKLSQYMNENGELVNANEVDFDAIPDESVVMDPKESLKQQQEKLFESENIAVSETKKED